MAKKTAAVKNSVVLYGNAFLMSVGASGARWSTEYPDAQLFTEEVARQQARLFNGSAYADWGTESARLLYELVG